MSSNDPVQARVRGNPAGQIDRTSSAQSQKGHQGDKAYVGAYPTTASFPFEVGETVWIVKPGFRAPLGAFTISKAHPNDCFELVHKTSNALHNELVEGQYLRRDPYAPIT